MRERSNKTPGQVLKIYEKIFYEFNKNGENKKVACEICGSFIEVQSEGDTAWKISCSCGNYKDTLRGL
jgi:hypothetical protein